MIEKQTDRSVADVRNFLCGYQLCIDMLNLRHYERKRRKPFETDFECNDVLEGDETYWRARMYEVESLIGNMRNGREKLVLYYHYIRGERIEHVADFLGFSRRTAYRVHQKGLLQASFLYEKAKKEGLILEETDPLED